MTSHGPSGDPRSTLAAAIAAASSGDELGTTLGALLSVGVDALAPSTAAILLQDPDRPGLQLAATHGIDEAGGERLLADAQTATHPFSEAATDRVATFDREAAAPDGGSSIGAYLPLIVSSGGVEVSLGALGMTWPGPRTLTDAERETLVAIASLASLAVDRARLASTAAERSEWFERMAHTDPLTGLANERTVARILELELARAGRQGSELSLALFDVDDFRSTNVEGGHALGDDILRRVAAVLAESVRLVDTVGRIGGDEFVLVAPGSAGGMVARRVLDGIAALPAIGGRSMSVSAGVARFPTDGADAEALIAAATDALQRAKDEGHGSVAETEAVPEA